jgi:hypothetical protein
LTNPIEGQALIFRLDGKAHASLLFGFFCPAKEDPVPRTERIRQSASGQLTWNEIQRFQNEGWKLSALEWERVVPEADTTIGHQPDHEDPPFGLRVAADSPTLVEDRTENETLLAMMELLIQDGPYSFIAEELNRRGFRTREGLKWSPVSVFEMLPRLIDAGPRILSSEPWRRRKQENLRSIRRPVV